MTLGCAVCQYQESERADNAWAEWVKTTCDSPGRCNEQMGEEDEVVIAELGDAR